MHALWYSEITLFCVIFADDFFKIYLIVPFKNKIMFFTLTSSSLKTRIKLIWQKSQKNFSMTEVKNFNSFDFFNHGDYKIQLQISYPETVDKNKEAETKHRYIINNLTLLFHVNMLLFCLYWDFSYAIYLIDRMSS